MLTSVPFSGCLHSRIPEKAQLNSAPHSPSSTASSNHSCEESQHDYYITIPPAFTPPLDQKRKAKRSKKRREEQHSQQGGQGGEEENEDGSEQDRELHFTPYEHRVLSLVFSSAFEGPFLKTADLTADRKTAGFPNAIQQNGQNGQNGNASRGIFLTGDEMVRFFSKRCPILAYCDGIQEEEGEGVEGVAWGPGGGRMARRILSIVTAMGGCPIVDPIVGSDTAENGPEVSHGLESFMVFYRFVTYVRCSLVRLLQKRRKRRGEKVREAFDIVISIDELMDWEKERMSGAIVEGGVKDVVGVMDLNHSQDYLRSGNNHLRSELGNAKHFDRSNDDGTENAWGSGSVTVNINDNDDENDLNNENGGEKTAASATTYTITFTTTTNIENDSRNNSITKKNTRKTITKTTTFRPGDLKWLAWYLRNLCDSADSASGDKGVDGSGSGNGNDVGVGSMEGRIIPIYSGDPPERKRGEGEEGGITRRMYETTKNATKNVLQTVKEVLPEGVKGVLPEAWVGGVGVDWGVDYGGAGGSPGDEVERMDSQREEWRRGIERWLNWVVGHPVIRDSFVLGMLLDGWSGSNNGLDDGFSDVKSLLEADLKQRHALFETISASAETEAATTAAISHQPYLRMLASTAVRLRIPELLNLAGRERDSERVLSGSLPRFSAEKDDDEVKNISTGICGVPGVIEASSEEGEGEVSAGSGGNFENHVIHVPSQHLTNEVTGEADDGFDLLPEASSSFGVGQTSKGTRNGVCIGAVVGTAMGDAVREGGQSQANRPAVYYGDTAFSLDSTIEMLGDHVSRVSKQLSMLRGAAGRVVGGGRGGRERTEIWKGLIAAKEDKRTASREDSLSAPIALKLPDELSTNSQSDMLILSTLSYLQSFSSSAVAASKCVTSAQNSEIIARRAHESALLSLKRCKGDLERFRESHNPSDSIEGDPDGSDLVAAVSSAASIVRQTSLVIGKAKNAKVKIAKRFAFDVSGFEGVRRRNLWEVGVIFARGERDAARGARREWERMLNAVDGTEEEKKESMIRIGGGKDGGGFGKYPEVIEGGRGEDFLLVLNEEDRKENFENANEDANRDNAYRENSTSGITFGDNANPYEATSSSTMCNNYNNPSGRTEGNENVFGADSDDEDSEGDELTASMQSLVEGILHWPSPPDIFDDEEGDGNGDESFDIDID